MLFQIGLTGITGIGGIIMNRKTLKEWELEKGVRVKSKKKLGKYTEKQLKRLIKSNYIVTKTQKGLEYLKNM